jgi:oligopeptide transport system ATP-binding protein
MFLRDFNSEILILREDIAIEKELNKNYKIVIDSLNDQFEEIHKEFLIGLKNYCAQQEFSREKTHQLVGFYNNKVKQKKESLKSFEIEVVNLKSDFTKMKHLVGVEENKLSKTFVKKILLKEKIYKSLEEVGLLRQFA